MSAKVKVWILAGLVVILAVALAWEIATHTDKLLQRPAAVADLKSAPAVEIKPSAGTPPVVEQSGPTSGDSPAADAHASGFEGRTLTREEKEMIAEEVKAQLAAEQAASGQGSYVGDAAPASADGTPPALDPAQRSFVVDSDISVTANGHECSLTKGDVLTRLTDTPDADRRVSATVSASKKADCQVGQTVAVRVDDLQEMYNSFRAQLDSGMGDLAHKQGAGGMPKAPDTKRSDILPPPPATQHVPHKGPLPIETMLENAQWSLSAGYLIAPPDNNALYWARRARRLDPNNQTAMQIEEAILRGGIQVIQSERRAGHYASAMQQLNALRSLYPNRSELAYLRSAIVADQSRASSPR